MVMQFDHPFHLVPGDDSARHVSQVFANDFPGVEPFGYKYPDLSIWYDNAAGAVPGCWHNGIDYALSLGTPLYVPADGTVVFAGWGAPETQPIDTRGFGNCVVIRHDALSRFTLYGHLSQIDVVVHQHVARGHELGKVGSTGNSSGPHLHWSVIRPSDLHYVDPAPYVSTPVKSGTHVVAFTVKADADGKPVRVFEGPSRQFKALRVESPGATLQCTAWTYGEPRLDKSTGQLDARWYRLAGGGWVASARVQGNAPHSTPLL